MNLLRKILYIFPLFLISVIFIFPLLKPGLIVGGDWTFPSSNKELRIFGNSAFSIWGRSEIPLGTQISHNNLYLVQILASLWSGAGLSGVSFQKATLFLTIFAIYLFSYHLFYKITKSQSASVIGAITYIFSPIVFNYLNMGWNYVLLFLALAPLFTEISISFFGDGKTKHVVALGLITAIGFFQSQAIVWFPLIFICVFISKTTQQNFIKNLQRLVLAGIGIGLIVFIVHMPWLIPIILNPGDLVNGTTSIDLKRFSEVITLANQFRLWGSLYNLQFEFAFPKSLAVLTFFPIIFGIAFPLFSTKKEKLPPYLLALLLVVIAPTLYLFRDIIASIPFSIVVRDVSRFLVISSLGVSLGVAISFSEIRNNLVRFIISLTLLLCAYPYFGGRLYVLSGHPTPDSPEYKDFRASLVNLPKIEYEPLLQQFSGEMNIFLPTAGFVFTQKDPRFSRDYWSIADIQSNFSPLASGVYYSEKSDILVSNFAKNYIALSSNIDRLTAYFKIYGFNNLLYRSGLESTYKSQLDRDGIQAKCQVIIPKIDSDWSVTSVCHIKDFYPLIFSSVTPQYPPKEFIKLISEFEDLKSYLVFLGCPDTQGGGNKICNFDKIDHLAVIAPLMGVPKKISETEYQVDADNMKGKFLLIFNRTYHPGWVLQDSSGERLDSPHLLVNQLVNGWVVDPAPNQETETFTIKFYPQSIYSKLLPISLFGFILAVLYLINVSKKKQ